MLAMEGYPRQSEAYDFFLFCVCVLFVLGMQILRELLFFYVE